MWVSFVPLMLGNGVGSDGCWIRSDGIRLDQGHDGGNFLVQAQRR